MHRIRSVFAILAMMALMVAFAVAPSLAQTQEGLVNVNISGNNVQVPIGVAANICPDVDVAVIAQDFTQTDAPVCNADADALADVPPGFNGKGNGKA